MPFLGVENSGLQPTQKLNRLGLHFRSGQSQMDTLDQKKSGYEMWFHFDPSLLTTLEEKMK